MQVSDEIIKVLEYLCEKIGVTIDWTSNNVLPYIQELMGKYIRYEISTSIVWLIIGLIMTISFVFWMRLIKNCGKKYTETRNVDYEIGQVFAIIGCVMCVVSGVVVSVSQIIDILRCSFFPELQIYQYVSNLIATMK